MPFLWTEGRFIMSRLEVPTLRDITAEREKTLFIPKQSFYKVCNCVQLFIIEML